MESIQLNLFKSFSDPLFNQVTPLSWVRIQKLFPLVIGDFLAQVVNRNMQEDLKRHIEIEQIEHIQRVYLAYFMSFFSSQYQLERSSC